MGYATWHWRAYNVFRRLIGLSFCLAGTFGLLGPVLQRMGLADGPPLTGDEIVLGSLAWCLAVGFGVFLCRRPTFRPDLGDFTLLDYFTPGRVMPTKTERSARGWWTGNPKRQTINDE
jgi:hypothetical protein